ncbi:MAG: hypothetical protein R3B51_01305 [Thermodesulfobacteriota bacterium]
MRPKNVEESAGQGHPRRGGGSYEDAGKAQHTLDDPVGPPGSGLRLRSASLATKLNADFVQINAISSGVKGS